MTRRKTIEDLQKEQEKLEQELKVKQQNLKMVKQQAKELDRKNRTHRLCTHGAMLEQYLNPDEFTDEQISYFMNEVFNDPGIKEFLQEIKKQTNTATEIL